MNPSGIDQSWSTADPKAAARAGVQVVSMYLSWSRSKNVTPAKVRAYHAQGIGVLLNWESQPGAPLKGAEQSQTDATESVRQIRELIAGVGYAPRNRLTDYFSCDRDTSPSDWSRIDPYYRRAGQICHPTFGVGAYGEAQLVEHLHAEGLTDSEWQTYAWSGGVLSPDTDFYQYQNGQRLGGASVDFDRVIHPAELGAWWPPGHQYDVPHATGRLTMDPQVKAAFAAIEARLDALPARVWQQPIRYSAPGTDKPITRPAATWLAYGANRAGRALHALRQHFGGSK